MTLLDYILGNYEEGTPERKFSEILSKEYENRFNSDDFDMKFNDVAGYKPIKTAAMNIAEKYLDSITDLNDSDRDTAIKAFLSAYDEVADKNYINVHAIIDGIVEDMIDDMELEDDDPEDSDIIEDLDDDDEDYVSDED